VNDAIATAHEVASDPAITNALLVWCVIELRRALPLMRALARHFKLTIPDPQPETTDR
jgi:hypothetical protein